ncbi:MAG: hypothetical protein ACI9TY_000976 [Alphaproteobacteria bacterium]|jgi:hypothetical protein
MKYENLQATNLDSLGIVRQLAVGFFGEEVSSVLDMKSWTDENFADFFAITSKSKPVAGYCLIYLNDKGVTDLINGDATGATFQMTHLENLNIVQLFI